MLRTFTLAFSEAEKLLLSDRRKLTKLKFRLTKDKRLRPKFSDYFKKIFIPVSLFIFIMARCDYCGETIKELPWTCKRCGQTFCGNHRLPETHDCQGIKHKNFFEPLTKNSKTKIQKEESQPYELNYEMYIPGRKKNSSYHRHHRSFNSKNFLSRYIYPRIQGDVKPHLMQFLLIFLIGLVLNYVYYQTFSLNYLFIGGVQEGFSVLIQTLNGFNASYDLFYLIINGIYHAYFYYSFVLVIYHTITNLDKRDTWVMLGWFALILWTLIHFFPQIA